MYSQEMHKWTFYHRFPLIHLNKFEFPSPNLSFEPSLVEIGPLVREKKIFKFHECIFAIS